VTLISRGVEISIAGGVVAMVRVFSFCWNGLCFVAMVRVLSLGRLFFLFSFLIMRYLFLGTKSLMQR